MDEILEDAMPGGCHPALEIYWDQVRDQLRRRQPVEALVMPRIRYLPAAIYLEPDETFPVRPIALDKLYLVREKIAGPVPYVGPRQMLWWWIYRDTFGRCIASDTVWRYQDVTETYTVPFPRRWPADWMTLADDDPHVEAGY